VIYFSAKAREPARRLLDLFEVAFTVRQRQIGSAVRLTRKAGSAGDPSLRLKNGSAQDDNRRSSEESVALWFDGNFVFAVDVGKAFEARVLNSYSARENAIVIS
jgi:hypothetical protein